MLNISTSWWRNQANSSQDHRGPAQTAQHPEWSCPLGGPGRLCQRPLGPQDESKESQHWLNNATIHTPRGKPVPAGL